MAPESSSNTPLSTKRILSLDTGSKRIGLAVWNPESRLATPLPALHRKTLKKDIEFFKELITKERIETILVGLPISLGGNETDSTRTALFWVDEMKKNFKLPVKTYDESLSSKEADGLLNELQKKNKKSHRDSFAAALFLEEFIKDQE